MNFLRNNLANAFTLGNLFSGCLGVISLLKGNYEITAVCLLVSALLDFFDGFVARALKANSSLGVQLDSLADMVTFGLIPGLTLYTALEETRPEFSWLKYVGLLVTLFSCLRLAIFNLDEEQRYYFKGLNTPTNTFLIFGLYYAFKEEGFLAGLMNEPWALVALAVISAGLLVSPVKMISMKFRNYSVKDNKPKIVLAIGGILILTIFRIPGVPLAVVWYLAVSLFFQRKLAA